jgi:23S rRNA pseudouridine955/2504/2580 synthase
VGGERTVRVDARAGKESLTEFTVLERYGTRATLIEAALHTGRTHQIRVHAVHAGHAVIGDEKYGDAAANAEMRALGLRRMFLHAHSCAFTWPESGVEQSFNSPLPADLRQLLDRLSENAPAGTRASRT